MIIRDIKRNVFHVLVAVLFMLGVTFLVNTTPSFALSFSPATLPAMTVGQPYSLSLSTSGGTAPYSYTITAGTLPAGISLSSSGTLSGTPTASGTFNFTVTAQDSNGSSPVTDSIAYSLTVAAPTITVSPSTLPAATVSSAYSRSLSASGGTAPYSYAITVGTLPVGLTLSSGGTLSGTPTASGTFNFTLTATDSSTGSGAFSGSRAYSLTVAAPTITISPSTLSAATVSSAYSQSLSASGGTAPYSYAITAGALPAGLTLSGGGTLSGTPTASGTFNFTLTATDSSTGSGPFFGSRAYSLTVDEPTITISPSALSAATVSSVYSQSLSASGGTAPYSYAITAGALPAGITLSSGGTLSGTPTASGTFNFTIAAQDSTTGSGPFFGSRAYSLTVDEPTSTDTPSHSSGRNHSQPTIPVTPAVSTTKVTFTIGSNAMQVGESDYVMNAAPFIQLGTNRTMVPARYLSEQLGAKVEWLSASRQVKIISGTTEIVLTIGSDVALVNGVDKKIDSSAMLENSVTFIPLRFIAEELGATVNWNASQPDQITITKTTNTN